MDVNLVDEFVEVIFMASAKVNEGLNGHIGVSRYVLPLGFVDDGYSIVREISKVRDRIVDIG